MMMRPASASVRDRTSEFQTIVERLCKSQGLPPPVYFGVNEGPFGPTHQLPGRASPGPAAAKQSDFARRASQIALSITKTSAKLQRLAALARKTSMFDDPTAEIDELTGLIKHEIQVHSEAVTELQRLASRAGADGRQSAEHALTVVDSLRGRLKDATAEFKEVLTARTDTVRVNNERRQLFSHQQESIGYAESAPLLQAGDGSGSRSASSLFGGGGQVRQRRGDGGLRGSPQTPMGGGGQMQQQMMVQQQQQGYASSRAEALSSVETTIVELGSMFTQLADLVHSQHEATQRIDENIDETLQHVDSAKAQLMRYLSSISSNRALMLKVFLVIMACLAAFVIFVA